MPLRRRPKVATTTGKARQIASPDESGAHGALSNGVTRATQGGDAHGSCTKNEW